MYGLYGCGLAPLACATYALPTCTYATAALPACGLGLNLACGNRYLW